MIINSIYFIFIVVLYIFSTLGHGIIFVKIFNINNRHTIGTLGLLGLVSLTFISYISVLLLSNKSLFNIFVILIGLVFFLINSREIKFTITNLIVIFCLLLSVFISKTHDDFPFYHLQQSLNFSLNELYIGLPNLNFFYAYHSSILYLNSLFYLPYFENYLFHIPLYLFLLFSTFILLENIFEKKNQNFLKFYSLFCILFILTKFSRLSEHGTDLSGQIIILVALIYFFNFFLKNKKDKNDLIIFLSLIVLTLTLKTYFIFYSLLIVYIIFRLGIKKSFEFLRKNKFFVIFSSTFLILFFLLNILTSGCLIFPIQFTCFTNLSWSMTPSELDHYSRWFEIWSKSLAGTGYVVDNSSYLVSNFNWIKIWLSNYLPKYLDTIYLLLILTILLILFFRPNFKKIKIDLDIKNLTIFLFAILLFWFFKHPALRYGGYLIHISLISILVSLILNNCKLKPQKISEISKFFLILAFGIFVIKNVTRIYSEIDRIDQYQYSNFPFYFIKKTNYQRIDYDNDFKIYFSKDACWATPPPCSANKNINITHLFRYKVINKSKK